MKKWNENEIATPSARNDRIHFQRKEKGTALMLVLLISVLLTIIVSAFVLTINYQKKLISYERRFDKALWLAETGISRVISGLKSQNDGIVWGMPSPPAWFNVYNTLKDDNNKEIGQYKLELVTSNFLDMTIKAFGKGTDADGTSQTRGIGIKLERFTLGAFAIASNHQLGGVHINGGTNIHGGLWTSGNLHIDAASCGIYNDYTNLNTNLGATYTVPAKLPNAEVFVYNDPGVTPPNPNGVLDVNSQEIGTATAPLVGVHLANTTEAVGTAGDGIIGNKEDKVVTALKDHTLPDATFPDVSVSNQYVQDRYADAVANNDSVYSTGDVTLNGSTSYTIGTGFQYNAATDILTISGCSFIGNLTTTRNLAIFGGVTYSGKGVIIVNGNITVTDGFEPTNKALFPGTHACALIATGNNSLGVNTGSATMYAGYFWGNTTMNIQKANLYGSIMGNTVNLPTTGTRPEIYIRPDLVSSLNVPVPDFSNAYVKKTHWWELAKEQGWN